MPSVHPADPDSADPSPFFSARLTPYRSLGPNGFVLLMLVTGAICLVSGFLFLVVGAWPVFAFFGLDVLIVYVAFKVNYAKAREYEEVHVSADDVHVIRVSARGEVQEHHINPVWARLQVTRLEDEGVTDIRLVSHGKALGIGAFLNPPDRESFAEALGKALALARSGGPDPSLHGV